MRKIRQIKSRLDVKFSELISSDTASKSFQFNFGCKKGSEIALYLLSSTCEFNMKLIRAFLFALENLLVRFVGKRNLAHHLMHEL